MAIQQHLSVVFLASLVLVSSAVRVDDAHEEVSKPSRIKQELNPDGSPATVMEKAAAGDAMAKEALADAEAGAKAAGGVASKLETTVEDVTLDCREANEELESERSFSGILDRQRNLQNKVSILKSKEGRASAALQVAEKERNVARDAASAASAEAAALEGMHWNLWNDRSKADTNARLQTAVFDTTKKLLDDAHTAKSASDQQAKAVEAKLVAAKRSVEIAEGSLDHRFAVTNAAEIDLRNKQGAAKAADKALEDSRNKFDQNYAIHSSLPPLLTRVLNVEADAKENAAHATSFAMHTMTQKDMANVALQKAEAAVEVQQQQADKAAGQQQQQQQKQQQQQQQAVNGTSEAEVISMPEVPQMPQGIPEVPQMPQGIPEVPQVPVALPKEMPQGTPEVPQTPVAIPSTDR